MVAEASGHDTIAALKRRLTGHDRLGAGCDFDRFDVFEQYYDAHRGGWQIDRADLPMTLLGKGKLDLIEHAMLRQRERGVSGDLIEAGVWRGGAVALMAALLRATGETGRRVVAADSFAGIPPDTQFPLDPVDRWPDRWVASLAEVQANLDQLGLLDQVELLPGLFADSLPKLAGRRFALMRLDADSYDSTMTALAWLYPLLCRDGVVIIDDWHLPGCKLAVINYVRRHGLQVKFREAHGNCYWFKREERLEPPLPASV